MPAPPETLGAGRYAVVRVLGEGGQATTFEAVDKRAGKLVAIKRFRVRGAGSWKEVELAEREARVLASIDHPSLPRYVDHFEEAGELFLVTLAIEGESLRSIKRRGAAFSEADAVRLIGDAADALGYLHGRAPPIIHRDIKPSNVIRRPDGSFAFIDFGAVRDRLKPEGGSTVVGTFGFMAPEQFQGRALPGSDVYAVGATVISMLTGRDPEQLPHRGLSIDVPTALGGSRVSPALVRALASMLDPDPDVRPASLDPLLAELGRERAGQGTRRASPPKHEPPPVARGKRRVGEGAEPAGGIGGALVFAVVVLALALAELTVLAALRLLVPLILTALSLVFGKRLRDAAARVSRAGKRAGASIARARAGVRGQDTRPRVRVDAAAGNPRRARVAIDEDQREAEQEAEAEQEERTTRSGKHR